MNIRQNIKGLIRLGFLCGIIAATLAAAGCCSSCDDCYDYEIKSSRIEGYAYFPYQDGGRYPVYYESGNEDILVTLRNQYGDPLEEYMTDEDGFYNFLDIRRGTYSVSAYITLYNPEQKQYDTYEADSRSFYVDSNKTIMVDLYLE